MIRRLAIVALAFFAPLAWGQSINIDLAHPGQGPPAGYAAAGLPGEWNVIEAVDPQIEYSLFDLHGQPTKVTVDQFGGTEILDAALGGAGDPIGNDALLLKDALITHTTIESCLFFNGFAPGFYEVLTYAWMPDEPSIRSNVHIDTNLIFTLVGGAWSGEHRERVSYARHIVEVGDGFLGPHSGVPSGGDFGIGAALNAMQIRKLGPEPPLFVSRDSISWLTALNANSYDVIRGELDVLRSTGDFSNATESCLVENFLGTELAYTEDPPPGGNWFLVRGDGLTWDSPGGGPAAPRDGAIAASPVACQ